MLLAPTTLKISVTSQEVLKPTSKSPQQIKESKINSFLSQLPSRRNQVGRKEAIAYLEICDWSVEEAIQDAKEDLGWEDGSHNRWFSEKSHLLAGAQTSNWGGL